jgi:hypothetical protein
MLKRRWLRAFMVTATVFGASAPAASCGDCFLQAEGPLVHVADLGAVLWVGDTYRIHATSYVDCNTTLDSQSEPHSFTFVSSHPSVATVSPEALVTSLTAGTANVKVSRGSSSPVSVVVEVSEPVAQVVITTTPAAPRIGDTVSVAVVARRSDGAPAAGAVLQPLKITLRRGNTPFTVTVLSGATPALARFVATDGTYEIVSVASRTTREPRSGVLTVSVPPP